MSNSGAIPIKIIMVGSINVGKTSLVTKYATGKNHTKKGSTKNASYVSKMKKVNGITFEIKLWDTAGQEKFKSLTKLFIKDAKIAILVYSIDDEQSFNDLDDWLNLIKSANDGANIIYGIVANKSDLESDKTLSDEIGKEYAKNLGATWRKTSAITEELKFEDYIDELFLKYHNSNFDVNTSNPESITLSIENSKAEKKGCCGGGNSNENQSANKQ